MDSTQLNVTGRKSGLSAGVIPISSDAVLAYRINDAVSVSGLSRSTIYNLINEKKLRSIVVAGRRLIPADALRELLQIA